MKKNNCLTLVGLRQFLNELKKIFAFKDVESKITNSKISDTMPNSQSIGDIWFVEKKRS